MSRSQTSSSDLKILASALSSISGAVAIRVRPGQSPTIDDSLQSLLYTLSLMTAAQRKARHAAGRLAGRSTHRRSSAA